jgi:hypothetical protein
MYNGIIYAIPIYHHLPEDEPSGSKPVEDVIIIRILV